MEASYTRLLPRPLLGAVRRKRSGTQTTRAHKPALSTRWTVLSTRGERTDIRANIEASKARMTEQIVIEGQEQEQLSFRNPQTPRKKHSNPPPLSNAFRLQPVTSRKYSGHYESQTLGSEPPYRLLRFLSLPMSRSTVIAARSSILPSLGTTIAIHSPKGPSPPASPPHTPQNHTVLGLADSHCNDSPPNPQQAHLLCPHRFRCT